MWTMHRQFYNKDIDKPLTVPWITGEKLQSTTILQAKCQDSMWLKQLSNIGRDNPNEQTTNNNSWIQDTYPALIKN